MGWWCPTPCPCCGLRWALWPPELCSRCWVTTRWGSEPAPGGQAGGRWVWPQPAVLRLSGAPGGTCTPPPVSGGAQLQPNQQWTRSVVTQSCGSQALAAVTCCTPLHLQAYYCWYRPTHGPCRTHTRDMCLPERAAALQTSSVHPAAHLAARVTFSSRCSPSHVPRTTAAGAELVGRPERRDVGGVCHGAHCLHPNPGAVPGQRHHRQPAAGHRLHL
jgi:hypothetical protein